MTNALAGKMDKSANGADIADISAFLNNLGLGAGSALPVGIPVPWPLAAAPAGWRNATVLPLRRRSILSWHWRIRR
jgi:hypothetical protein